jgi:hypothetical protein
LNSIRTLKYLNLVFAGLFGLLALANVLFIVIGLVAVIDGQKDGFAFVLLGLAFFVIGGALAYAHAYAGFMITAGRARHLQTALAMLHLPNVPLGTAYAAYALWVCHYNESSRTIFDRPAGRRVL